MDAYRVGRFIPASFSIMLCMVTPPSLKVSAPSARLTMPTMQPQKPTMQQTKMILLNTFPIFAKV